MKESHVLWIWRLTVVGLLAWIAITANNEYQLQAGIVHGFVAAIERAEGY